MKDIIEHIARIKDERKMPRGMEYHERYVRAMDAACERVDVECRATGKQLSEAERQVAIENHFRIEAGKVGMLPNEIEGHLYISAEIQRISAGVTVAKAV